MPANAVNWDAESPASSLTCVAPGCVEAADVQIGELCKRFCCMRLRSSVLCLHCRALFAVERMSAFHAQIVDTLQSQLVGAFNRYGGPAGPPYLYFCSNCLAPDGLPCECSD